MTRTKSEVLNIIKASHITEKSTQTTGKLPCYAFKVTPAANKKQIKQAVEIAFGVVVESVNTCSVKAKTARFGRVMGKRSGWKKAYVRLAEGHSIELSE